MSKQDCPDCNAESEKVCCNACNGTGRCGYVTCETCDGTGEVEDDDMEGTGEE